MTTSKKASRKPTNRKSDPNKVEAAKAEVKALIEKMEAGVAELQSSEGWTKWLQFQANLYTYSWNNTWLIAVQCPGASIVMGYRKWQELGRQVKKGEKSIRILAPSFRKVEDKETGESKSILAYFRSVPVFDVSQTEGDEIPAPCHMLEGGDEGLFDALKAYSEAQGVPVELEDIQGPVNGYYDCVGKFIRVKSSNAPAQQAKTLAHEIAHSLLHSDLSRDEQSRGDRELEAESVAYIVCHHFGLDTGDYSFGYVAHWKKDEAKDGLKKSAKRIADAAKQIIEALEGATATAEEPEMAAA